MLYIPLCCVHYLVQVLPDLALSGDEEDPKLDTAEEDLVTDYQVGTILHYCLTSLQSQVPQSGHAATSDPPREVTREVAPEVATRL